MRQTEIMNLPKIELHCHLDGSIRPQTALELGIDLGLLPADTTLEAVVDLLRAPADCDSLVTYLKRFDLPIALMQTEAVIERVAFELFEDAAVESVRYLEARYAPDLHIRSGLTLQQVISAAIRGMRRAEAQYPIKGNWILSHLRHHTPESMVALVEAGRPFLGEGVVAVDLAGAENLGYAQDFIEPVALARTLGYRITMHAGETGYSENVREAIELLGATRVGHGCAIVKDDAVRDLVLERGVTVEACPTSNLQTRIVKRPEEHPIQAFCQQGLLAMVNTDNRTVSNTDMSGEYALLEATFGWDVETFKRIYENSLNGAFCDAATKAWLRDEWSHYEAKQR